MPNQNWSPKDYKAKAEFVTIWGKPLIEMLAPRKGEKILDLGCGDGSLTKELMDMGTDIIGADTSADMVEAARSIGVNAVLIDGERLEYDGEFDAVVSNAAIHWMSDHYAVVRGVWNALRPGGRFAAECGGEGCVRIIREGMKIALTERGIDYKSRNPWQFPELVTFGRILQEQGFAVREISRFDRPTRLPQGLRGWLEVFSERHTEGMSAKEREAFYSEVEDYCRPMLYSEKDGWTADYVRLRFLAEKPA